MYEDEVSTMIGKVLHAERLFKFPVVGIHRQSDWFRQSCVPEEGVQEEGHTFRLLHLVYCTVEGVEPGLREVGTDTHLYSIRLHHLHTEAAARSGCCYYYSRTVECTQEVPSQIWAV